MSITQKKRSGESPAETLENALALMEGSAEYYRHVRGHYTRIRDGWKAVKSQMRQQSKALEQFYTVRHKIEQIARDQGWTEDSSLTAVDYLTQDNGR